MTFDEYINGEDYLAHYGILGMKWGIRRTPEQLGHYVEKQQNKLKKSVEAARNFRDAGDVEGLRKQNKKTDKILEKINQANSEIEELNKQKEVDRQKLLREGTADEIYARKSDYSVAELNDAIVRLQTENRLQQIPFDEADKSVQRLVNMGNNFVRGFNTYESTANTVNKILGKDFLPNFTKKYEKKKNQEVNDIVRSGDLETIINNRNKLSNSEYKEALARIDSEQKTRSTLSKAFNEASIRIHDVNHQIESIKAAKSKAQANKSDAEDVLKSNKTSLKNVEKTIDKYEDKRKDVQKELDKYNRQINRGQTTSISPTEYSNLIDRRESYSTAISQAEIHKSALNNNIRVSEDAIKDYTDAIKTANTKLNDIKKPSKEAEAFINGFNDRYYESLAGRY